MTHALFQIAGRQKCAHEAPAAQMEMHNVPHILRDGEGNSDDCSGRSYSTGYKADNKLS